MPTTRKQKIARKSRVLEILSDIENFDIMLGENHFITREREMKAGTVIKLEDLIVSLVTILGMMTRVCTRTVEILVQGLMPITAKTQSVPFLLQRLIDCRAN